MRDSRADAPEPPPPTAMPASGHYGFSYMQAAVMARQAAEHAARSLQQELQSYLDVPLEAVTNVVEWWGVSPPTYVILILPDSLL